MGHYQVKKEASTFSTTEETKEWKKKTNSTGKIGGRCESALVGVEKKKSETRRENVNLWHPDGSRKTQH